MSPFEYIIPLVSVIVGLAIADLAVSFNRLLRAHERVEWDWLPLLAAFVAIVAVLDIWWMFYRAQEATFYHSLAGFLPFAAQLILLFLINAAALPDDVPEEGINLKKFYEGNSSYFWSLFVIYFISIFVTRAASILMLDWDIINMFKKTTWNLIIVVFFGSLIFVKNRWYHSILIITFLALYMSQWSVRSLATFTLTSTNY
ncbi:MAG: hypothetical protein IPL46_01165 [Saprospiraceae bacterium]|nr:hypothetical protein [Saprospiraceae bacterium]